jgi:hypothetical protein
MLPRPQDLAVNFRMQVVWRAVVNHVQIRMRQQRLDAAVGMRNIQRLRPLVGLGLRAFSQGHHLHKPEPAQGFDMRRANKTAADNANVNHEYLLQRNHRKHGLKQE